jgi:hypothetical protein
MQLEHHPLRAKRSITLYAPKETNGEQLFSNVLNLELKDAKQQETSSLN